MDVINSRPLVHQKVFILTIFVLVSSFAFILYLLQPPKFPDDIPAYYPGRNELTGESVIKEKKAFFNEFTQYTKENHGGLLVSRELNRVAAMGGEKNNLIIEFQQQYKYFNRSLFLSLIKNFANQQGIQFFIKEKPSLSTLFPNQYEIEFANNNQTWLKIKVEAGKAITNSYSSHTLKAETTTTEPLPAEDTPSPFAKTNKPKLAIVIGNFGNDLSLVKEFLSISVPITFAVRPQMNYSNETAELLHKKGKEILLHLPMEPESWPNVDPGAGAVFRNDTPEQIERTIENNLESVPHAVGINNFMGSAFSKDLYAMQQVMRYLETKKLFFVNSKTVSGIIAEQTATQRKVGFLSRDIFLDNIKDEKSIRIQLYKGIRLAIKRGQAVIIGQATPLTLKVIKENLDLAKEKEVEIVPASSLTS